LNRNQAEALLSGHDNGVFLIRDSVLFRGRLTLSFVNNDSFEHYIIERYFNNVTIDNQLWFASVNDLIKVSGLNFLEPFLRKLIFDVFIFLKPILSFIR
jgi:uncharacterized membrane protein